MFAILLVSKLNTLEMCLVTKDWKDFFKPDYFKPDPNPDGTTAG